MLPEEQELKRLENEQSALEEQVASAELALETLKTETDRFRHRYYQAVGRLYVQLDEIESQLAQARMWQEPDDPAVQAQAHSAQEQAKRSAEEAGLIEARPPPPPEISPELKQIYRQATRLMHPDRATNEAERVRRTELMARVNGAYERGDHKAIQRLITEFGEDPEAVAGEDVASRIVKGIRRIAQLRRRLGELQRDLRIQQHTEIQQLKKTIETAEAMGGDPLGELIQQLTRTISERKIQLEIARQALA